MKRELLNDLTTLVEDSVITPETAEKIKEYYRLKEEQSPNRSGMVLAILGAILIGSGIILIVAHNWDDFGRLAKTIFSFLPLGLSQLLCLYSIVKKKDAVWRESAAASLYLSVGACISLISQVYQVSGTLSGFLMTWTLLGLPLVYTLSSSTVVLFTIASITWWAGLVGYSERPSTVPYLYMPVMAALIPYYVFLFRKNRSGNFLFLINVFASLSLLVVMAAFLQETDIWYQWIFAAYLVLLCIYYNISRLRSLQDHPAMYKPFYVVSVIGILTVLFMWSFPWLWDDWKKLKPEAFFVSPTPYLLLCLLVILFLLVRRNYRSTASVADYPLGFSALIFILALFFFNSSPSFGTLLINAGILSLGLLYIRKGGKLNHFGILNFGLSIIGLLAVFRFFDDSIPFAWRGFFFLVTGAGFFIANYQLIRKRKQLKQTVAP